MGHDVVSPRQVCALSTPKSNSAFSFACLAMPHCTATDTRSARVQSRAYSPGEVARARIAASACLQCRGDAGDVGEPIQGRRVWLAQVFQMHRDGRLIPAGIGDAQPVRIRFPQMAGHVRASASRYSAACCSVICRSVNRRAVGTRLLRSTAACGYGEGRIARMMACRSATSTRFTPFGGSTCSGLSVVC